jgi:homoserine O-succinyltransferase
MTAPPALRIALLNNMPDAALQQTETQFRDLLAAALPGQDVRLVLFTLPELARQDAARQRIAAQYAPFAALFEPGPGGLPFDGLIVTGMECAASALHATGFWPSLARVIDFAAAGALPTVWSCLAAHAAVLHLHGIERRRLPAKLSGLFACAATGAAHPYAAGLPPAWQTPHSRYNDLPEAALRARGYRILSRGGQIGVDAFAAPHLPFLFLQGHPEYDPRALLREFMRDAARAASGARDSFPAVPADLFDPATAQALTELIARADHALAAGAAVKPLLAELSARARAARVRSHHAPGTPSLFANWAASLTRAASPRASSRALERMAS